MLDLLNERVAEAEAFHPHDFTIYLATILTYSLCIPLHSVLQHINCCHNIVPTDRRSFRTGPKKILKVRSAQDLKIAKRTSKDLFFDPGTMIRFFKMASLEF